MGLDDPAAFVRSAGLPSVVVEAILAGNADALVESVVQASGLQGAAAEEA